LGSEWGVLDGKKSADELLEVFEKPDLKRSEEYEGICQLMFGFGNGARQVIITDVEGTWIVGCIFKVSLRLKLVLTIIPDRNSPSLDQANHRVRSCRVRCLRISFSQPA
jgi:hypothetical protein